MSQRRMFSPKIIGSDDFLDMPGTSQALYYHLGMYADDDGFVSPRKIMRMMNASEDDLKILIAKHFLISFKNNIVVIKHWRMNNLIRKDWYRETQYEEEKKTLFLKENGAYTLNKNIGVPLTARDCKQLVNEKLTNRKHRLGKDSISKYNIVVNPDGLRLAQFLFERIRANYAGAKEPNFDAWAKEMNNLLEKDKRSVEEVEYMIRWCQADNFWAGNILSPGKLRKQWDKLAIIISKQKQ